MPLDNRQEFYQRMWEAACAEKVILISEVEKLFGVSLDLGFEAGQATNEIEDTEWFDFCEKLLRAVVDPNARIALPFIGRHRNSRAAGGQVIRAIAHKFGDQVEITFF